MSSQHRLLASVAMTLALVAAVPGAALAQTQDLGSVTVRDTAIDESEAVSSYKVTRATSATRTDTPLVDVPQSVTVVTVKQIEDQGANNIGEAIRYVPGVFSAQGEGNRETLVFRGNATTGDFFVDGVRDDVQTYRDLYNIEQLQIFKGPNAMIFGRGGVGGLVNRVTKVADWTPHRAFRVEAGSFEHKRAQFDLGTPLSDSVSVRLTGVYQDSESYRNGVNFNRWGFNPTVTFKAGPDTTITLGYEHFRDDRIADRGVSSFAGKALDVPRGQFFGNAALSPSWTETDAGTLFVEHRFSDSVVLRNRTRYANYDKFYQNVFPVNTNAAAETVTALTTNRPGLAIGTYTPGTRVEIQAYNNLMKRENFVSQTDLNIDFATGSIKHTLLAGFEYSHQKTSNTRTEGDFTVPGVVGTVRTVYAPVAQSEVYFPISWSAPTTSNNGTTELAAGYIQDQIELSPQFQIVAGVRFESINTKVTNRLTSANFEVTNNVWSPRFGVIFKPAENASIYASYSKTYLPRGGDQLTSLSATNILFAAQPEKYINYEVGAKWDIVPTFNVSVALFQLDRDNVIVPDINNPGFNTLAGAQRTRGFELGFAGNITDTLSLVGSYTYTDAKFTQDISATQKAGARPANIPEHAFSLWGRYNIAKVGLAAGVIHQGKRFAATDNSVYMDGYTRVDAALYYDFAKELSLQINIENLFNERYIQFAHNNTNLTPGSPRAIKVGLNAKF